MASWGGSVAGAEGLGPPSSSLGDSGGRAPPYRKARILFMSCFKSGCFGLDEARVHFG